MASRSAELNGLSGKMRFICADARDIREHCREESFSLAVCNPPYFEGGSGVPCAESSLHLARHESTAGLADFFKAASYALKKGGRLYMVHRPERLADLMSVSRNFGLEPKALRMVVPFAGESPKQLLIKFVKGGGKGLSVLPELAVRSRAGGFTEEIEKIYERA